MKRLVVDLQALIALLQGKTLPHAYRSPATRKKPPLLCNPLEKILLTIWE